MLLEVTGLTKRFGGLVAIREVDLQVEEGSIVGLIGPNGSGKTTFFNLISGYYRPNHGRIIFGGTDLVGKRPHEITPLGLTRTFQICRPFTGISVHENVMVGAFCHHSNNREVMRIADEILNRVGLYRRRDELAGNLPLAEIKRLEMARALATQPKLLLLDEVMAGLNPTEQNEIVRVVERLPEQGITLLVVEHALRVIMSLAQRVVVLNYGQKIADGEPAHVVHDPNVVAAYLGEETERAGA